MALEVTFLGTGNAFGSGGRHAASILLRSDDLSVLLDCGPSALANMKKLGKSPRDLAFIFVSHHHGDHFAGTPFFLVEFQYNQKRRRRLTIVGPSGTRDKVEQLGRLLFPGLETSPREFPLVFVEMELGESHRWHGLEAHAFRVAHFPRGIAFGYRVTIGARTVVYSGDTGWTDELARQSQDADLLICECSTYRTKIDHHLSYDDLERHSEELGAQRTLLVHCGDEVLRRRSELAFELAEDGQEIHL